MANTKTQWSGTGGSYPVNGTNRVFQYTFEAIDPANDVRATIDGIDITASTFTVNHTASPTTITFNSTTASDQQESSGAPKTGTVVRVYRDTKVETSKAIFQSGSTIKAGDLNRNFEQALFSAQEEQDQQIQNYQIAPDAITTDKIKDGTIVNADISTTAEIAVSKLADGAARQVLQTAADGTSVEWTDNVDLPGTLGVTGAAVFDSTVNIDGTLTSNGLGHFKDNLTLTADSKTFTIENASGADKFTVASSTGDTVIAGDVTLGASTGNTISFNGEVDTSINPSGAMKALGSSTKQWHSIHTNQLYTYGPTTLGDHSSDAITIKGAADFDHTVNIDGTLTVDSVTGDFIVTSGTSNSDTKVYSAKRAEEIFFNATTSETIKDGDAFPDNDTTIATTAAINDRIIDLVDDVGGFWPIANETSFPSANPDVNNGSGTIVSIKALSSAITTGSGVTSKVIANGAGSGVNVTITGLTQNSTYGAGMGMLVETTSTLHTYAFHRLSPSATEVTTVAANIGSVNTVATNIANVNTVATNIANVNTVASNNTNVTNIGSNIGNVNTCATNLTDIANYADTYQIKTSAPTTREDSSALQIGDLWFDSSSNKVMMVRDGSAGDGYAAVTPNQSVLADIAIVSGNITYTEDLGLITDALTTGTGNSIETCADNITEIQRLGTADAVADMNTLGTAAIVADMNLLGTADCVADMALLATTDCIADMNTLANADVISDMNTLATADIVSDMNTLATADVVSDLNTLATSDVVSDMNTLATSGNITAMDNCSGSISNINTVSGSISNVNTTAGSISNVNTTAGSISNVNTVAGSIADVNRYADEYTISSSTPSSPSEGDLWYNSTGNTLNYYNSSSWVGIAPGISAVVSDSAPQLGGNLNVNTKNIIFGDSSGTSDDRLTFGAGTDLSIYHSGSHSFITNSGGDLVIGYSNVYIQPVSGENGLRSVANGTTELYYDAVKKLETTATGTTVTGLLTADTIDGSAGSNLTLDFGTL